MLSEREKREIAEGMQEFFQDLAAERPDLFTPASVRSHVVALLYSLAITRNNRRITHLLNDEQWIREVLDNALRLRPADAD